MRHKIFAEIDKFDLWAQSQFDIPQEELGGEWECDYDHWEAIYESFEALINVTDPNKLTSYEKERLLYIIARDNEMEHLSSLLDGQFLIVLSEYAISKGHREDKWQLAVQLYKLADKGKAVSLLEKFVNDDEEYVNRRSLMELAKLDADKVESYAEIFWNKEKYADIEEYQKIAVLHSLNVINSPLLDKYIELATQSGQTYLINYAIEIQNRRGCI
ncbi:hypothetical protein ACX0G7_27165 [Flavitalea antarctica]